MNKDVRRMAQRMLRRAQELGLLTKEGKPLVVDLMEELVAAGEGYRNAHAYRDALSRREPPSLVLEHPDEAGSDFKLVHGRGCWLTMGPFSVHPYLTDEGVVVDVYAKGAEDETIASTWAHNNDAEDAYCDWTGIDIEDVAQWAQAQGVKDFDQLSSEQRLSWMKRYHERDRAKDSGPSSIEKTPCVGCGLPTQVDDEGLCNQCSKDAEGDQR
mgnify:CR=1 FL=1